MKSKAFIWVNLSNAQRIQDADVEIAESCIFVVKKFNKGQATKLRQRLVSEASETTGRNIQGGIAPGGVGGKVTSIYQETMAPIRSIAVRDIIRESTDFLRSKGQRIYLFVDEADFFDDEYADQLTHLCQRIKQLIPDNSVMMLANRDLRGRLGEEYQSSRSLLRSTFRHHHRLDSLWEEGKADVPMFLETRMKRGQPMRDYKFPFSQNACRILDILSAGNFKLLLQYVETCLIHGSIREERRPLNASFVRRMIADTFDDVTVRNEDERTVLEHLLRNPTHVSDKSFTNIVGSRTNLQDILLELEDRRLVNRSSKKSGVKQIYSVTQKGRMLLNE
ncbi:MAG: hypothetical protein JRI70_09310 [Deltaproteobacteria bacterium]|nr:hypothetical protein [Deltaproteobacteria bacterium]